MSAEITWERTIGRGNAISHEVVSSGPCRPTVDRLLGYCSSFTFMGTGGGVWTLGNNRVFL